MPGVGRMRRRDFLGALGGAAAWPFAVRAQQPAMPSIGFLNSGSPDGYAPMLAGFAQGLKDTSFIEGRNVAIEYRWLAGRYETAPVAAAELVSRRVAVIVANTPGNLAAKAATTTIPIVFSTGGDPVEMGLVASLNRPGGNVTGVTQLNQEVAPKRLQLAHELVPTATTIGLLVKSSSPNTEPQVRDLRSAARTLGLELHVLHAGTEQDLDTAFATLTQLSALVIGSDGFFNSRSKLLAALTLRHQIPAIYEDRAFAVAGCLMSYGGSTPDMYRIAGTYTGRILKGEKPADLPVQQGTKSELIINMRTAKALSLTFPISLLGRADEVIE
jgi:putative ABC transport system substrate-binding protein